MSIIEAHYYVTIVELFEQITYVVSIEKTERFSHGGLLQLYRLLPHDYSDGTLHGWHTQ